MIPDHVLLKPEVLAPAEMEIMKTHTTVGAKILSGSSSPVLNSGEVIALTHHERWDGAGYPRGLIGAEIPLAGRVVAVVDAFDAMTHDRPYRPAYSPADAWQILWAGAGTQWEESLIEAFSKMLGPAAAPTRS